MQSVEAMETALNQLAEVLATRSGREFTRTIRITEAISDISVGKSTVRIHPSCIVGANLGDLMSRVFDLEDVFVYKRHEFIDESVKHSRQQVERHLRILKRHDPHLHEWLLPILFSSERKSLCGMPS